jgi:hypothetical protein
MTRIPNTGGERKKLPEDVHGLGEYVVVDEPGVDGEDAHERDEVATVEEVIPDLIVRLPRFQLLLLHNRYMVIYGSIEVLTTIKIRKFKFYYYPFEFWFSLQVHFCT